MLYPILRPLAVLVCKPYFRLSSTGREWIPRKGGLLLVSNHSSYLDPVVLGAACPRPLYFFARAELFRNFWFGGLIRALHAFPVDIRRALDKDAIERAVKELKEGKVVVVFPEGTRSRAGELCSGQAGAGFFAVKAQVPVIPVYIEGAHQAYPPGSKMIYPRKISVHFGKPLTFAPPSEKEKVSLAQHGHRQAY
jgi:1-acyl-sn-glycerol-3-phosphate acyltransferase